jgi:hypothetical protein
MKSLSTRRLRILRLRQIEHRIANIRLARADLALNSLVQLTDRISHLKSDNAPTSGITNGMTLRSQSEITARLDAVAANMVQPIRQAEATKADVNASRLIARRKEESAAKLYEAANANEAAALDLREDTNRPFRPHTQKMKEAS